MNREAEIQTLSCPVIILEVEDLDDIIEDLKNILTSQHEQTNEKIREEESSPNYFGEEKQQDKLIVMDGISSLADCSYAFFSFLTVPKKSGTAAFIVST